MTFPKRMVLQKKVNYKIKGQKRQIDTMPVHQPVFPSFTYILFPYHRCL
ncbi:hypothetical protein HMPREF9141_1602 [Prevotella multiformis DSM 16608]|uniref:Uncharacterized protein n=1 Tax=Prevotella multiformis DSM 16608 TaxID=888743 RepID=F0F7N5_9BACT|nr:hypothetical protein HMPREF9141_1602 [Prevotella multiformis DSM 16608]